MYGTVIRSPPYALIPELFFAFDIHFWRREKWITIACVQTVVNVGILYDHTPTVRLFSAGNNVCDMWYHQPHYHSCAKCATRACLASHLSTNLLANGVVIVAILVHARILPEVYPLAMILRPCPHRHDRSATEVALSTKTPVTTAIALTTFALIPLLLIVANDSLRTIVSIQSRPPLLSPSLHIVHISRLSRSPTVFLHVHVVHPLQ